MARRRKKKTEGKTLVEVFASEDAAVSVVEVQSAIVGNGWRNDDTTPYYRVQCKLCEHEPVIVTAKRLATPCGNGHRRAIVGHGT